MKLDNTYAFNILTFSRLLILLEADARRCSVQKVFLKISKNSHGNTCAKVFFFSLSILKSESHFAENLCLIRLFPSLVRKNINICSVGVSKWRKKKKSFHKCKFCFQEKHADLHQTSIIIYNNIMWNQKYLFLLRI